MTYPFAHAPAFRRSHVALWRGFHETRVHKNLQEIILDRSVRLLYSVYVDAAKVYRTNHSAAARAGRARYKVKKRKERERGGLCTVCGGSTESTFKTCAHCRARKNRNRKGAREQFRAKRLEAGICLACGKQNEGKRTTCAKCRAAVSRARIALVVSYRANGLCVCGEREPSVGVLCENCWYKSRATGCGLGAVWWEELKNLLVAQGFRCAYSGKLMVLGSDATIDHKIPRSRGGTNDISNLHWVSRRVNQMKTDFTHDEFIAACRVIANKWQKRPNQLRIA